jgi:histidine triad (HIT) family protein
VATVFSRIIEGDLPGRFVWSDERCVAFLSIAPLRSGHTLVVPREEVDQWTDADDDLLAHLLTVGKQIGTVQRGAFDAPRSGVVIAGFEVPHLHVHVFPAWGMTDFDFALAQTDPDPDEMDAAAEMLRRALRDAGFAGRVPD